MAMTYEPTVTDPSGAAIPDLVVVVNNEIRGLTAMRTTDGNGYANVAMIMEENGQVVEWPAGDRVTIEIRDNQFRFKGYQAGDAMTVGQANGKFSVVLNPFV